MDKESVKILHYTPTPKVDDAVGVPQIKKQKWFVAIVNNRSEKKYAQILNSEGYEVFVPIQREERIWRNGTVKAVDRVLLPAMIFIYCSENERKEIVKKPFVKRFMVDQTQKDKNGKHPIAIIPDNQIEIFREILDKADEPVTIEPLPLNVGDKVKVIRGRLKGMKGKVLQQRNGKTFLIVEINLLGCAKLGVSLGDVEKIES